MDVYAIPVIKGEGALSVYRRPIINNQVSWGMGFFGDRPVTIGELVIVDERGERRTLKLHATVCVFPDCTLQVTIQKARAV